MARLLLRNSLQCAAGCWYGVLTWSPAFLRRDFNLFSKCFCRGSDRLCSRCWLWLNFYGLVNGFFFFPSGFVLKVCLCLAEYCLAEYCLLVIPTERRLEFYEVNLSYIRLMLKAILIKIFIQTGEIHRHSWGVICWKVLIFEVSSYGTLVLSLFVDRFLIQRIPMVRMVPVHVR